MDRILARSSCVCLHGCIKLGGWGRPSFSVLLGHPPQRHPLNRPARLQLRPRLRRRRQRSRLRTFVFGGRGTGGVSRTAAAPVAQAVGHRRAALGRRRRPCGWLLAPAQQGGHLPGRRAARPCPPRAFAAVARAAVSAPCRQAWELAQRWRGKQRTAFIASAAPPPPSSAPRQGGEEEGPRAGGCLPAAAAGVPTAGPRRRRPPPRSLDRINKCYLFGSKLLRIEKCDILDDERRGKR